MRYIGHEREREIFSKALKSEKLVHAYIFSGKESCGKKLLAREIARSLFCGCGLFEESASRHSAQVDALNHPDLHIFEDDSIPIEKVRRMSETAFMSPHSASHKIFIIDNAHNMRTEASNAFLKTLEEPGENTVFFLITDKYDRLLPTIRSRCVHIEFSRLSDSEVVQIIRKIRPDAANYDAAVKLAAGSVAQALYFLDNNASEKWMLFEDLSGEKLYKRLESLKEKDDIRIFSSVLYGFILEKYRSTGDPVLLEFSNYLLDILQRLNYNVNLDIFRFDLFTKITEVLIERD
ncbi:MAG: AAA family ATPase [Deferribacterales bacterium]